MVRAPAQAPEAPAQPQEKPDEPVENVEEAKADEDAVLQQIIKDTGVLFYFFIFLFLFLLSIYFSKYICFFYLRF